jgi:hypothetical protein
MTEVEQLDLCFPFPTVLLGQFSQRALNQLGEMLAIVASNAWLVEAHNLPLAPSSPMKLRRQDKSVVVWACRKSVAG